MAEFINEEETENLEISNDEELVDVGTNANEDTTDSIEEVEQPVVEEKEELPEKYQGKSTSEIIQMHREAEKLVGRQSSEVGDLRKIVDDFIQANLDKNSPQQQEQVEEDLDFWSDPEKAVEAKLKNNPDLKEVKEISKQLRQQQVESKLNTEYPDWQKTINDEGFADWVRGSNVRSQLFADASSNYNWDSANELLGTWATINQAKKATQETMKVDTEAQKKAASTGTSRAADSKPSKKIYRRSDIINLMQTNPDRYMQLSEEITKAYSEGRVR